MPRTSSSIRNVAVIGAGVAGTTCAVALQRAGHRVTLYDKSRGPGGRMATRRAQWEDEAGVSRTVEFDHGAQLITARHPRLRALLGSAVDAGVARRWRPRVFTGGIGTYDVAAFVAQPGMPALCRHWLGDLPVRLGHAVQGLQQVGAGWRLSLEGSGSAVHDEVVLAMPPQQAAALLAGHHERWTEALSQNRMEPCWTLMAVTEDVDWPWDAAEPVRGPLSWVARNDRKPGRNAPAGLATWVAHATPAWSAAHLEEEPQAVAEVLSDALGALLPGGARRTVRFEHRVAHRWRYAMPAAPAHDARAAWWDASRGLGVCGDFLGGGAIEGAWRSGEELAERMLGEPVTRRELVAS